MQAVPQILSILEKRSRLLGDAAVSEGQRSVLPRHRHPLPATDTATWRQIGVAYGRGEGEESRQSGRVGSIFPRFFLG